jgi:hypothetical protein
MGWGFEVSVTTYTRQHFLATDICCVPEQTALISSEASRQSRRVRGEAPPSRGEQQLVEDERQPRASEERGIVLPNARVLSKFARKYCWQ